MKKSVFIAAICLGTTSVQADDTTTATAKKLHAENCLSCHKPDIYTREKPKITSREKLSSQVRICVQQLQLQWFDEEMKNVTDYLNQEYYHFP